MKKQIKKIKFTLIILLVGLLIFSCTEDSVFQSSKVLSLRSGNPDLFEISYEMDYTIFVKNPDALMGVDRATVSPISEKQKIKMTIRDNGDVKLETEKLQSQNEMIVPHQTLPNNLPKIVKTVLDGGKMDLIDAEGNLIRSIEGQSISMPMIAEHAKSILSELDISRILSCQRSKMNIDVLMDIINNPPADASVSVISDKIAAFRMPLPPEISVGEAKEVVNIVDTERKVLLGSRLYGENDIVLQCIIYRYEDCIFKGFKQEVKEVLPSGEEVIMQTFANVENFDINYLQ